jgi:nicotinamide riboside kinase
LACGVPVFIDTDLYVIKVWSEIAFNKCDNNILTQIAKRPYDLYLLCNTDLPWVKDSLREYPDLHTRETIYQHYLDVMVHQQTEWTAINGNYEERLATAIKAVDQLCALS